VVLLLSLQKIDRAAVDEGDFAMDNGGTDGARDGGEHSEQWSLHEIFSTESKGVSV
jgi:hypothetical protein